MTNHLEFFAELMAPIPKDQIKIRAAQGGRQLSYITARTVMNRLDDVAGPENWWDSYHPLEHSVICKLSIRLPDGEVVTKCDAGGYAGMADQGDDDKSGFSDAFKRAAFKFGIGRHLYNDGMPRFAVDYHLGKRTMRAGQIPKEIFRDPEKAEMVAREIDREEDERRIRYEVPQKVPKGHEGPDRPAGPSSGQAMAQAMEHNRRQEAPEPPPVTPPKIHKPGGVPPVNPKLNPGGRDAFTWLKSVEKHFGVGVVKAWYAEAKRLGWPWETEKLDSSQLAHVVAWAYDMVTGQKSYRGEWDAPDDAPPTHVETAKVLRDQLVARCLEGAAIQFGTEDPTPQQGGEIYKGLYGVYASRQGVDPSNVPPLRSLRDGNMLGDLLDLSGEYLRELRGDVA